jgi:hypothetical protein
MYKKLLLALTPSPQPESMPSCFQCINLAQVNSLTRPLSSLYLGNTNNLGEANTCDSWVLVPNSARLTANCQDNTGNFVSTSILISNCVANNNGILLPPGVRTMSSHAIA